MLNFVLLRPVTFNYRVYQDGNHKFRGGKFDFKPVRFRMALLTKGTPSYIHVASIIASRPALSYIQDKFPQAQTMVWIAALDDEFDSHSYIVPGLGDAGDLAYGEKL